ncbi:Sodium channel protein Nach [Atta colombica]|uniref:Sodium channel protein Nach n=1 Tax=Atta colombica TaxID=520822 RepID=A0A151I487_9HYME|nr:Sodium channel protein Nach [Atta colombica]
MLLGPQQNPELRYSVNGNGCGEGTYMKSNQRKLRKLMRAVRNGVTRIKFRGNESQSKQFNAIIQTLNYFCMHTTIHGLRHIVNPELHIIERFLWLVVFVISSTIASNVIYSLALRFQDAPTVIDIESVHYGTSYLPFPSVTLCPNDRVDWNRVLELELKIFPNGTDKASLETFRKILGKLSMMSFGDFDELDFLKNQNVHSLAGINITQVLYEVMPRCDQLLSSCWWRNADRNCCDIFQVQKTEYGFCYSFNSEVAQTPPTDPTESWPRRASGYGDWTGVKVTIHLGSITKPSNSKQVDGVVVIINEPHVWPNSGTMIPSGSLVSMSLQCISGYATQRVLELDKDKQPCQYDENGVYHQETCLSLCKRYWVANIFRRYNQLIPGRFITQRYRASLLSGECDVFLFAIAIENRRKAEKPIKRDPYASAAHTGLQSSKTVGEKDTDFHELRPRRVEFEQILNYREVFQWASCLESLYQPCLTAKLRRTAIEAAFVGMDSATLQRMCERFRPRIEAN